MNRSRCARPRSLVVSFALFSLLGLAISGCSGGGGGSATITPPSVSLTSIAVTPGNVSVVAGLTQQFKATGAYSDGTSSDVTSSVTWASGTTSVATINAAGLATTKTQGSSVIMASVGSVSGSETLAVSAAQLVSINVTTVPVHLGATEQVTATGTYTNQSTQDLTATVTWTASNGYVASVSPSGVVTSLGAGYATLTATLGSVQGRAPVTVVASPRYVYIASAAGRNLTRTAVASNSGQPRFEGYIPSLVTGSLGFPCLTVDPSGKHAYLTTQIQGPGGSGYAGTVGIYAVNSSTGTLTALPGNPYPVSFALGCLEFAPSGTSAYAVNGIEEVANELGEFSVNDDGTLTLNDTISLAYVPSGVSVDPLGQYAYVAVSDIPSGTVATSEIYGYSIDPAAGGLTALDGSPWPVAAGTYGQLAFHPSGDFLYLSNLNATSITEYTVNRGSGALTAAGTFDSTCINPSGLQFLPNGNNGYAFCGESSARSVENAPVVEYSVNADGQLAEQSTALAGPAAMQMQVDASGKFVYVLGSGSDSVSVSGATNVVGNMLLVYQVQPDGSLKLTNQIAGQQQEESMALLSGPAPVAWTTTNAYVTTSGDNKMTSYTVGADGTLTAGMSVPTSPGPFSASMLPWGSDLILATQTAGLNLDSYVTAGAMISIGNSFGSPSAAVGAVVDPVGDYAYAADAGSGLVYEFYRPLPGYWSILDDSPGVPETFPAQTGAGPITMDPSGRYVVVANQTARSLSLIEPLGAAPTPATSVAYTPLTVAVDGTGNLIFVAGDDGKLHMLSSNGMGTLTDLADGALLGANTVSVAVDPLSRFAYAAGPAGLNAFSINITAGTLTPIALNLTVPLANATGVFEDPTGQFLYVAVSSGTTNAMYLFAINADGTLTASSANPVATPNHATSMVFNATIQ